MTRVDVLDNQVHGSDGDGWKVDGWRAVFVVVATMVVMVVVGVVMVMLVFVELVSAVLGVVMVVVVVQLMLVLLLETGEFVGDVAGAGGEDVLVEVVGGL